VIETTALGAAFLAGLAIDYWTDIREIESVWQAERVFRPCMLRDEVAQRRARWAAALGRARSWESSS
jgi:glycerol kinase